MNLVKLIDFRNSSVLSLEENKGIISLDLYNDTFDVYFYMEFSCTDYKWSIQDVISEREYDLYSDCFVKCVDEIIKIQEIEMPNWANFKK